MVQNFLSCETCPFKGQTKVYGEGSRIVKEYKEIIPSQQKGVTFKRDVVERDSSGQYDIVVVGMAPAREEVIQERPFVGPSGHLLRSTLEQMGVKDYYLCNVLLCSITDEDKTKEAVRCCRRVIEEIVQRKPKLTIALGNLPLHTLADIDYDIKSLEGRVIPSHVGPLLPLVHPAYYLRNPDEFFDFIECMRPGLKFLDNSYEQCVEPTLTEVTPQNYQEVLQKLDKYDYIGVDTETTGFHANGWDPDSLLEMGLAVTYDHAYIVMPELIPEFKQLLEEKKGVYWNAQFDVAFLKKVGISPKVDFDGMLAHYALDERAYSHGLKRVAKIYLGADDWEKNIEQYLPARQRKLTSYSVIPTEVRHEYLSKDVTRTLQLKHVLEDGMDSNSKKVFQELLMPATRMFSDIEDRGMPIDPVKLMNMEPILQADLDRLEKELFELTGEWINPNSVNDVRDLLYKKMNIPQDPRMGESTSKQVLEAYKDNPVISRILDFRQAKKMLGTYVEGFARFVDRSYRIHPKINVFKTVTGRLSSEDPSIMNIKVDSKLKEIFLPDPGTYLGYGDIKGNELRWYCVIGGDEDLIKIFKDGGDPHHVVSTVAFGEDRARDMRLQAKTVVFGRMYGRGRKAIEAQVGSEVIDQLMETVDSVFPHLQDYVKDTLTQLKSGVLLSYFGRKRRFLLITQENRHHIEREAVNFRIQSPGSDLMLKCMLHLWDLKEEWDIWPFWPVHDSITSNIPDPSILIKMKKELENFSEDISGHKVPFVWDMNFGNDWSMKNKPADWQKKWPELTKIIKE